MSTALVTGASSGIGAQYAVQLAALGYDVVLVGRDRAALEVVAARVGESGRSAEVLAADLTVPADLQRVCARAAGDDISVLVNNAGVGTPGEFVASDADTEQAMLDLNVTAVMRLCHAAFPGMLRRDRGAIVNIASVAAFTPSDGGPGYSASKAYVAMFTESLALKAHGTRVRVLAVFPGFVRTAFHPRLGMDTSWIPRWAWLRPEDVVRASLQDLRAGRTRSVPSARYKVAMALARAVPRPLLRRVLATSTPHIDRA
ncbi:SDR family NAD(P)-dependent oxidoreductase [Cumulibacter manganitolerans]|uniref:SDR family NAD(P)-dependent oxidoreductase n=1 Tax=Cumulibacter manganitolerans TaxID=1884992 RepID=UPI0012949B1B|nr:SDR family oxidoreductase [Cumulibacter manganitolerans]